MEIKSIFMVTKIFAFTILIVTITACQSFRIAQKVDEINIGKVYPSQRKIPYIYILPKYIYSDIGHLFDDALGEIPFVSATTYIDNDLICIIDFKFLGRIGAGPEFITMFSLFIVPWYWSDAPFMNIKYKIYDSGDLVRSTIYTINYDELVWFFSVPVAYGPYGNEFRLKNALKDTARDFYDSLQ